MIDDRRTSLDECYATVPIDRFEFPDECLLCGDSHASPTPVILKRTLSIGIALRQFHFETIKLPIPLCATHAIDYEHRHTNRSIKIYGLLIVGLLLFVGGAFLSDRHREDSRFVYLMFSGLPLLATSLWLALRRQFDFPVRLHTRETRPFEYSAFVLYFPDEESTKRFIAANKQNNETNTH